MKTKKSSPTSALFALPMLLSLPTGCAHVSSAPKESLNLYQPPVLRLQKAQVISTQDGLYIPQADELWHSDARYRAAEQDAINAAAALAQERARSSH